MALLTNLSNYIATLGSTGKDVDHRWLKPVLTDLRDALAGRLLSTTVVVTDATGGNGTISGQVTDGLGNNVTSKQQLLVSIAAAAAGAVTDIGNNTAGAGTVVSPIVTDKFLMVETNATGAWSITIDLDATPDDVFVTAAVLNITRGNGTVAA